MPSIEFKGLKAYQKQIAALSNPNTVESMCKYSIYDAAGYVLEELKKAAPVESGDLRDSIIATPMQSKDGFTYEKLDFAGYDRKGVPNRLKARVLESGRSGPTGISGKHPFVRLTVRRCTKLAEFMMDKAVNQYLSHFMKKEK